MVHKMKWKLDSNAKTSIWHEFSDVGFPNTNGSNDSNTNDVGIILDLYVFVGT